MGKSTLVRQFCQENKFQLFEINLQERPLKSLLKEGFPIDDVIGEIEFLHKMKISSPKALLFIDEIQDQPKAINLLRYFYEKKNEIAVIAAGSLLEVVIIVGGMPEAVQAYAETNNFVESQKVQHQILETYKSDFFKYASQGKIPKLDMVFD